MGVVRGPLPFLPEQLFDLCETEGGVLLSEEREMFSLELSIRCLRLLFRAGVSLEHHDCLLDRTSLSSAGLKSGYHM